ncbi:secretin N-terminal domain-containing protein [Mesorhizobium sp. M0571]|uniref:secretin N-terminal domain-containing protein n=1 Tax=Mesorhizobium sp. M0571 TaxID=2956960 RepID=UPI0033368FBA
MDGALAERMGAEPASAATAFASAGANLPVTADVENNALLIQTTARDYERIERILAQLDVLLTQVLLESTSFPDPPVTAASGMAFSGGRASGCRRMDVAASECGEDDR